MSLKQKCLAVALFGALIAALLTGCGGGTGGASPAPSGSLSAPTLQASQASTLRMGAAGGSVTATALNGTVYTLTVPFGALTSDVDITLTPISDMGDAPLASGLLGAVQMEPSGLVFARQATLSMTGLPPASAGKRMVGFGSNNEGGGFRLNLALTQGAAVTLQISHFSTGGASEATEAQINAIPLAPLNPTDPMDILEDQLMRVVPVNGGELDYAKAFRSWYDVYLRPRLDDAGASQDSTQWEKAVDLFHSYFLYRQRIAVLGEFSLGFNNAFATEDAHARPLVAKLLNALIDREIASCKQAGSSGFALDVADYWQIRAAFFQLDTAGSGLERSSFLLKVNQCLRIVLDPITLPADLTVGTNKSLEARASVVFAHLPNPQAAHFEFTVTPVQGVSGIRKGFADGAGRFTTTFKPTSLPVEMLVKACLVLDQLGPTVGSDICTSQTVTYYVVPPGYTIFSGTIVRQAHALTVDADDSIFLRVAVRKQTGHLILVEARGTQHFVRFNPRIQCIGGFAVGTGEWTTTVAASTNNVVTQTTQLGAGASGFMAIPSVTLGYMSSPDDHCVQVRQSMDNPNDTTTLNYGFELDVNGVSTVIFPGYNVNGRLLPE